MNTKNKLYVLTDKTLDPVYASVQGGHAVAEWLLQHWQLNEEGDTQWSWNNDYLIYVSVDIDKWYNELINFDPSKYQWVHFNEPDLDNKITAIAIYEKDFPNSIQIKLKHEKLFKNG